MSIKRNHTSPRMSQTVVHDSTVYLAGQVAQGAPGAPAADQTRDILGRIDELLAEVGSDKTKVLAATIWLADMGDFAAMNEVWDNWVDPDNAPARACVQSPALAAPQFTVEIMVTAAV